MTNRSYKIIFILLSCCILFILLIQGYWIRNFYLSEKNAFDRNVYTALEKITIKLQERKNLQALKMTYFIVDGDTIAKTPSRSMTIQTENEVSVVNHNEKNLSTGQITVHKYKAQITTDPSASDQKKHISEKTILKRKQKPSRDSLIIDGNIKDLNIIMMDKGAKVTVYDEKKGSSYKKKIDKNTTLIGKTNEIKKLIDKMMTEIKVMDTRSEQPDTLNAIIKRALSDQGLFLPFEFSMQKLERKQKEILAQSKDYSDLHTTYKSDLSSGKIISTHDYLFLQFPLQTNFVMASVESSLALSLLFSLIILAVFYYVMHLLRNQKRLNEIKNDFINNMTHELKTPIATISLAVDGLNNPLIKNDPEKFEEYTRILKEENYKLNSHVERVLQMALLEKGDLQLHSQPLNLVTLIQSAIDAYGLQIQKKNAIISFVCTEKEMILNADELQLGNVFTNLLDNALKYSRDHDIRIDISCVRLNDDVVIVFKDNGIGMDPKSQEKVFDKFYRVQGGNLHDVKGFGLGLSYTRSVIAAHGGNITLSSEKGKGSEFTITFKLHAN